MKIQKKHHQEPWNIWFNGHRFNEKIDFQSLWNKIEKDNNLIFGRNYFNHTATWYGRVDYAYTGVRHKAQDMPSEFLRIARKLEDEFKYPRGYFNCVLANAYNNKGIAPHSDDELIFVQDDGTIGAVATISLGEPTTITISRKDNSKPDTVFEQRDGDIYIMPEGDFQYKYKHSASPSKGKRISITFRHIGI